MKKISLFIAILSIFIFVTGCTPKNNKNGNGGDSVTPNQNSESSLTSAEEQMIKDIEEKNYENLTPEEQALVDKITKEAKEDVASREKIEDQKQQADMDLVDELTELEGRKKTGEAARGSCDAIAESSTCLEYVGDFWTVDQMRNNCADSGVFSTKPCPTGSAGGCNLGNGTISDMITWFYLSGGGGITESSLKSAQQVCDMNPMGRWILAN
jgi:hypothetical protein